MFVACHTSISLHTIQIIVIMFKTYANYVGLIVRTIVHGSLFMSLADLEGASRLPHPTPPPLGDAPTPSQYAGAKF